MIGNIDKNDGMGRNDGITSNPDPTQHRCASIDHRSVFDRRVCRDVLRNAAKRHALIDRHIVPDHAPLTYDDANRMRQT